MGEHDWTTSVFLPGEKKDPRESNAAAVSITGREREAGVDNGPLLFFLSSTGAKKNAPPWLHWWGKEGKWFCSFLSPWAEVEEVFIHPNPGYWGWLMEGPDVKGIVSCIRSDIDCPLSLSLSLQLCVRLQSEKVSSYLISLSPPYPKSDDAIAQRELSENKAISRPRRCRLCIN